MLKAHAVQGKGTSNIPSAAPTEGLPTSSPAHMWILEGVNKLSIIYWCHCSRIGNYVIATEKKRPHISISQDYLSHRNLRYRTTCPSSSLPPVRTRRKTPVMPNMWPRHHDRYEFTRNINFMMLTVAQKIQKHKHIFAI